MPGTDSVEPHVMDGILPTEEGSESESETVRSAAMLRGIMSKDRIELFEDKAYYTVLVFQCAEQVKAFVEQAGWKQEGGEYWIDGVKLAKQLGFVLPQVNTKMLADAYSAKPNPSLAPAIARGLEFFTLAEKVGEKHD